MWNHSLVAKRKYNYRPSHYCKHSLTCYKSRTVLIFVWYYSGCTEDNHLMHALDYNSHCTGKSQGTIDLSFLCHTDDTYDISDKLNQNSIIIIWYDNLWKSCIFIHLGQFYSTIHHPMSCSFNHSSIQLFILRIAHSLIHSFVHSNVSCLQTL